LVNQPPPRRSPMPRFWPSADTPFTPDKFEELEEVASRVAAEASVIQGEYMKDRP
jgi:hypothetical protein